MRVSDYEGRADWGRIVLNVPCQICGAREGEPCRNMGAAPGTLWAGAPRNDHHQVRKELAILIHEQRRELGLLEKIEQQLTKPTPTRVMFKELTMNPTQAGQTQVFTGTVSPNGAVFPAGTTFTVTSNDPAVVPTLDTTGLIVSVTYPQGWTESTTVPLTFSWQTGTFVPVPSSSPSQITEIITPSAPPAGTATPTQVGFTQTT